MANPIHKLRKWKCAFVHPSFPYKSRLCVLDFHSTLHRIYSFILFFETSRKMAAFLIQDEDTVWNPINDKFDELSFSDYLLSDQIDGTDLEGMLSLYSSPEKNDVLCPHADYDLKDDMNVGSGYEGPSAQEEVDEGDIAAVVNPYLGAISNCVDFGGSECMEWSTDPLSQPPSVEPMHKRIKLCHEQQFHDTLIPRYLHEANSFQHLQNVMKKLDFGMRQCITSSLYSLAGSTIRLRSHLLLQQHLEDLHC